MTNPQTIYPALRYRDADAALRFLADAFDATENAVYRDDGNVIRHAQVEIAGNLVMFGTADEDGFLGGETPRALASTISLYIAVDDPDAWHARASRAGANVVRELEEMDYGSREFSVRDPEGNLWSLGTYQPAAGT